MVALRDFRLGAAVFAAEFVLSGAFLVSSSTVLHYALYEVYAGVALAAVIWSVRRYRPRPALPWLIFAGGIALFITGDVLTDVYPHWTSPSPADGFYLAAYPLFAAMAVLLVVSSGGYRRIGAIADGLIVTFAFAVFQWIFVMSPVLHEHGSLGGKIVLGGLYPFMDILLLGAYAGFFASPAWRTPAFGLLVLGMAMQLLGDEATGLAQPSHNVTGTWAAAPWALSYVFWGIAVLHPSMRDLSRSDRTPSRHVSYWRTTSLAAALVLAPVARVIADARGKTVGVYVVAVLGIVLALLVVARLSGILRALERIRAREESARLMAEDAHAPARRPERAARRGRPAEGRVRRTRVARPAHATHVDHRLRRARARRGRARRSTPNAAAFSRSWHGAPTGCCDSSTTCCSPPVCRPVS